MNLINSSLNDEVAFKSELRELTSDEIDEISGGNPISVAVGAATGALGYISTSTVSGSFSYGGLALATGAGAITGVFSPVTAISAYVVPRVSFIGGYAIGAADSS